MAQALFDDHPIELYLRESGEVPDLMPGGLNEFTTEPTHGTVPYKLAAVQTWFSRFFNTIQPAFGPILTGFRRSSTSSEFAERFKYVVISSALLSSSLSSSSITRAATPTTPGHFDQSSSILSPSSSADIPTVSGDGPHIPTHALACLVLLALIRGYYLACILLLAAMKYLSDGSLYFSTSLGFSNGGEPWTLTLDCLEALITANNTWDNVVTETLGILETEEQSASLPPSPSSSFPSLRTALSSSLHTTEMQCDNIRQLLAALTSPLVLSQLSHMYAPPPPSRISASPKRSRPISLAPPSPEHFHTTSRVRPLSLSNPSDDVYTRSRVGLASQISLADKRSTWSGSYTLVHGSSRRPRGRRPSRSAVIRAEDLDTPKTPAFSVSRDSSHVSTPPATMKDVTNVADAEDEPFGVAALDLHRSRRNMRAPLLTSPSLSSNIAHLSLPGTPSQFHASNGPLLTSSLGSIFTALSSPPTSRAHHLSLSNLHLALQGALGSKRFVCAHLLALRFSDFGNLQSRNHSGSDVDSEDESYWEDVRSVISLLTSTLEGASARLAEALADLVQRQEQESGIITDEEASSTLTSHESMEPNNSSELPLSFAPMPSHLARFAAHIDAISSALDDARDHLRQCVASLREDPEVTSSVSDDPESPPTVLQSYERLRRELGLALRECERGRGTLLGVVKQTPPDHLAEEGGEEAPIPHEEQFSSGESDKTLYNSHEVHEPKHVYVGQGQDHDPFIHEDDATSHLILTATSQNLPPPGIEQVFESVSATQPFVRERSKLTREERIHMAKARRESQCSPHRSMPSSHKGEPYLMREKWGPGGEVVQELKDVIWQVSERRRKMIERSSLTPQSDTSHSPI